MRLWQDKHLCSQGRLLPPGTKFSTSSRLLNDSVQKSVSWALGNRMGGDMKKKAGKGVCQPSLWGVLIRCHTTESHTLGTYTVPMGQEYCPRCASPSAWGPQYGWEEAWWGLPSWELNREPPLPNWLRGTEGWHLAGIWLEAVLSSQRPPTVSWGLPQPRTCELPQWGHRLHHAGKESLQS